jgi:DNA-binding transcriptional LysR family regulator
MKNATLRQLTVFEVVARCQSFTRAARSLGVTQAAVSIQIKQLEENLGVALFEQLGKRIYLTEAGRDLFHYCRRIGEQLSEAETVLERHRGSQGGQLCLCIGRTAKYFVPRLLAAFRQRWDGFSVNLSVAGRDTLLGRLAENTCDMVIMGRPPMEADCVSEVFLEDPLVVIAAANHPLVAERAIPLSKLSQEPFIMREPGSETRDEIERYLAQRGITLAVSMVIDSNEAIKQAVQAGLGVAIVPLHSVSLEVKTKHLTVLDVEEMLLQRSWFLVYRKGKRFSRVAEAFKNFVLQEARNCIQDDPPAYGRTLADGPTLMPSIESSRTDYQTL